jgi:hypothetical protein
VAARIGKENPPRSTHDSYRSFKSGRSHQPLRAVSGDSIPITRKLSAVHGRVNGEAADKLSAVHYTYMQEIPQEAPMCHRVYVTLSVEDKKDVKKLSGIMIPVYATIVLVVVAVVAVTGSSRQNERIASTAVSAATR